MRNQTALYAVFAGLTMFAFAAADMGPGEQSAGARERQALLHAGPATCSDPVEQAFAELQREIGLISDLTLQAPSSEDGADRLWDEVYARATAMARTLERLEDPRAGLSPFEADQVERTRPFVHDILIEAQAARLELSARTPDLDALAHQQDAVGRAAGATLDLLIAGRECVAAPFEISEAWAPHERCESLDPEYQAALSGPCVY